MRAYSMLYHDVVPAGRFDLSGFQSPDADLYKLSCEEFEDHLEAIAASVDEPLVAAPALLRRDRRRPAVLITFDDGGASGIRHIADMLEARGWPGHFFITTDFIGTPRFMSAPELRDLRRRGHVVGSHSASHPPRMAACSPDRLDREWSDSIRRLSDLLGDVVDVASVPGGYYSHDVGAAAARAGIRVLFNSEPVSRIHDLDGCAIVGRFGIQRGVPSSWAAAIVRGDRAPRALRYLHWNGKKVLKTLGGDSWLRLRRWLIAARART